MKWMLFERISVQIEFFRKNHHSTLLGQAKLSVASFVHISQVNQLQNGHKVLSLQQEKAN